MNKFILIIFLMGTYWVKPAVAQSEKDLPPLPAPVLKGVTIIRIDKDSKKKIVKKIPPPKEESTFQIGLGLGSILSSRVQGERGGESFSSDYQSSSIFGIYLRDLPAHSVGAEVGFEYIPSRSNKSGEAEINLTSYVVKGNLAWRGQNLYIFGGPNFANYQIKMEYDSNTWNTWSYTALGGWGFQGGLGWMVKDSAAMELEYEKTKFDLQETLTDFSNQSYEYQSKAYMDNIRLTFKIFF